jgi:hypothetical protein
MAITYTWKVTSIKTKTEGANQGAVVQTYWTKTGKDSAGNEGTFSGATPFTTLTMPAGATFVPLTDLTEETVLTWIKAVVVGGYEEHVNGVIQKAINDKVTPVEEAQMPWAPVIVPVVDPVVPAPV